MQLKAIFFVALTVLSANQAVLANQSSNEEIIKSPNDTRFYQTFTLANKLQVLVISDPDTDKAAASLNVSVGSADNPVNRPGLAHFLEHMLFLGTKKFPLANEYSTFIDSHGGSQNAFTSQDNTNYYFDIKQDSLDDALDRFSQFFISPLFSEKYTDRERQAVHSEYQARLKDDAQRNYAVFKKIMNPEHPGSRFFIGSLATLSDNKQSKIRDDLMSFYQKSYSANNMNLVILGKEPLSELKALAIKYFSSIENKNTDKLSIKVPRLDPNLLPRLLKVKTLKDFRLLTLTFPTPSSKAFYRHKPLSYLSALVGYEGEGSLIAYLKERGLANSLRTSSSIESDVESAFQVSISLTPKGLDKRDLVVESFFSFIAKMHKGGVKADLYNEEKRLSAQAFKFIAKQSPASYVVHLSQVLDEYPQQNWLNAGYLMEQFSAPDITSFLAKIVPDNMLVNLQAKQLATNQTEPLFGGQYSSQQLSPEQLSLWRNPSDNPKLFIRSDNPYIAEDLSLVVGQIDTVIDAKPLAPSLNSISEGVTLWHLQDKTFLTPKANLFFSLFMPVKKLDLKDKLALDLYASLLNDKLNKQLYDAASAGLYISLYAHRRGLSVRVSGYNDKQTLLIQELAALSEFTFSQQRFDIIKDNFQRSLSNQLKDKPYQQLLSKLTQQLLDSANTEQKLAALADIKLEDVYQISKTLFSRAELRILSHGNVDLNEAKEITSLVQKQLNIQKVVKVSDSQLVQELQPSNFLELEQQLDNTDSAVVWYLQGVDNSYKQRAATTLLSEMIASDYANQLRTEQQLGYLVFASNMSLHKMPGLTLITQSPDASVAKINNSNQAFLERFTQRLLNIPSTEFETFKLSLIARYKTKERTIYQRSSRFWSELNYKILNFDERQALISAVQSLTLKDSQQSWQAMLQKQIRLSGFSSDEPSNN
ncbi:MAG: insulinase family protein [Oceanospirillaceae bacterium]